MRFLKLQTTELHPDQKVIKAAELTVFREAEAIVAQANKERDAILEQAKIDHEAEKVRGFDEGMLEAKIQISEQMITTVEKSVSYLEGIERSLVDIVLSAVRNIIGEIDDHDRIKSVVRKVLATARDQKRVTLRVSRSDEDSVKADLDNILRDFPGISFIDIDADPRLHQGDCILETDIGVVEATLESQIQSVKTALTKNLAIVE